jgi:hypothetical protein
MEFSTVPPTSPTEVLARDGRSRVDASRHAIAVTERRLNVRDWRIALAFVALAGAGAGGLAVASIGALTETAVDEPDAHVCAEGITRGGAMVSTDQTQRDAAAAILDQAN